MLIREALRDFQKNLKEIPPEHLTQESLKFLADQMDLLIDRMDDVEMRVYTHTHGGGEG